MRRCSTRMRRSRVLPCVPPLGRRSGARATIQCGAPIVHVAFFRAPSCRERSPAHPPSSNTEDLGPLWSPCGGYGSSWFKSSLPDHVPSGREDGQHEIEPTWQHRRDTLPGTRRKRGCRARRRPTTRPPQVGDWPAALPRACGVLTPLLKAAGRWCAHRRYEALLALRHAAEQVRSASDNGASGPPRTVAMAPSAPHGRPRRPVARTRALPPPALAGSRARRPVLPRADIDAQHLALALGVQGGGHNDAHQYDAPTFAHLLGERVQREGAVGTIVERSPEETPHYGAEFRVDA